MKIIACLATSLDGKIAASASPRKRIGSREDWHHLLRVRNLADAIVCGGETFRHHPLVRQGTEQSRPPLQCILTRSFDLPPEARLFRESVPPNTSAAPVPVLIFSPQIPPEDLKTHYPPHVEWIATGEENPAQVVSRTLTQRGVQVLLVEGGGYIMNLFLQAKALDELYLTLCPLLLGGREDATLVTGSGFSVDGAPRTETLSAEWREQELYLHLRLHYPGGSDIYSRFRN